MSVKSEHSLLAIITDACSSQEIKGYMTTTVKWVDKNWVFHSAVLDFKSFCTPRAQEIIIYTVIQIILWFEN